MKVVYHGSKHVRDSVIPSGEKSGLFKFIVGQQERCVL